MITTGKVFDNKINKITQVLALCHLFVDTEVFVVLLSIRLLTLLVAMDI